ncbi:hypothetical protein P280DRAFT_459804 [Massarina eburnea CBS 473.64]|uniref:Uncharacterized protein n=1 Tax=Massarina eburnea CBS 473.64 TaxID=1395130 RepID=A0A6A6RMD0_9PLEO|nr:hypothetical protein P280DRAFT_459804 [Massarina eburnea CBS 473.64]
MALHLTLADPEPWAIEQQIFNLLSSYLQPTSTTPSADAARSFDALLPDHRADDGSDKESTRDFLWNAWEAVHKIAQQIPDDHSAHERLAQFLLALKQVRSDPPSVTMGNWGTFSLWEDLPGFVSTLREVVDRASGAEYRNLNAYLARVFRDGTADTSFWALRHINRAVGYDYDYNKLGKKGKPTVIREFGLPIDDNAIQGAGIWIEVAGEAIWKACRDNGDGPASTNADDWTFENGFFLKRWQFWVERYAELLELQGVDDGNVVSEVWREKAEKTKRLMEEIQTR